MPLDVVLHRPDPQAETVELPVRPPRDRIDRTVEPVPRVPRPRRRAPDDPGAPVEEALRTLRLPHAGHRLCDEGAVTKPTEIPVLRERRRCRIRPRRGLTVENDLDRPRYKPRLHGGRVPARDAHHTRRPARLPQGPASRVSPC